MESIFLGAIDRFCTEEEVSMAYKVDIHADTETSALEAAEPVLLPAGIGDFLPQPTVTPSRSIIHHAGMLREADDSKQKIQPLAVGPEEAGRISGHARSAIYEAIGSGELISFKSGKRRLILIKELEAWLSRTSKSKTK